MPTMTGNNPNLEFVNMNANIRFGENLLICSQDIKRKHYCLRQSRAITVTNRPKMTGNNLIQIGIASPYECIYKMW